jgi:VIT1/CCC1 family predicted Fe2+/Mn2+ transporter
MERNEEPQEESIPMETSPGQRELIPDDQWEYHDKGDRHGQAGRLSEVILGGQDGLVNTLGLVLGVAAASSDRIIILAAGLSATIAECISMGGVAYTSKLAEKDFYKSEYAREQRHIEKVPMIEQYEIRELFRRKGFEGELLNQIVETVTKDEKIWIDVMLKEEHGIQPVTRKEAAIQAVVVFFACLVGAIIPLIPFFITDLPTNIGIWVSLALSTVVLFSVGIYQSIKLKVGRPLLKGLELALIGVASALAGWGVGLGFNTLKGGT